jgi:RNA polymerase sigma-70 factor, ECF subfamily
VRALLESLYREHRQGLYTLALSITRSAPTAEDAVQAAFARLCRRSVPPEGDAVAYVFAAVRNAALDQVRRGPRESPAGDSVFANQRSRPADGPHDAALARERDGLIRAAIEALPEEQRETVVLRLYGGLTFEQVAQTLGEPLSTVASRYRRALEQVRKEVESRV